MLHSISYLIIIPLILNKTIGAISGQILKMPLDVSIEKAMVGVLNTVHQNNCVISLIYDELLLKTPMVLDQQLNDLQSNSRIFLVLDLSTKELKSNESSQESGEILIDYLHKLYRNSRCYTFIIWLTDPRDLFYEKGSKTHPGWRFQDTVIFTSHHITKRYKSLIEEKFWNVIPNVLSLKRKDDLGVNIFTVLPYYTNGRRKSNELDVWLTKEKKFLKNATLIWDKFTSFNNASLKLGVLWRAPFLIWGDLQKPFFDGLDWRLIQLVKKSLKFQLKDAFGKYRNNSGSFRNGKWSGVMGLIESGEADIGLGGISVTPNRLNSFDFCRPYYTDSYSFITPINTTIPSVLSLLKKPFSTDVWNILFLTSLTVTISMKILASLEKYLIIPSSLTTDRFFTSFSHNIYHLINTFCQKPFYHLPHSLALKCIYVSTSASFTILGMIFGGCMFSQLLQNHNDTSVNSIREIVHSGLPISIMNYDGQLNNYFESSSRRGLNKIYKRANFVDYQASFLAMDEVVKGNKIYIDSTARINFIGRYRYMGKSGLKFHVGKNLIVPETSIGWPIRQNWPWQPKVDKIITQAVESGLIQYWMGNFKNGKFGWDSEAVNIARYKSKLSPRNNKTFEYDPASVLSQSRNSVFTPLGIDKFIGINNLWFGGMSIGIFVFIIELFTHGTFLSISLLKKLILKIVLFIKRRGMRMEKYNEHDFQLELLNLKKKLEKNGRVKNLDAYSKKNKMMFEKRRHDILRRKRLKRVLTHNQSNLSVDLVWTDFDISNKYKMKRIIGNIPEN